MIRSLLMAGFWLGAAGLAAGYDDLAVYEQRTLRGFTVLVHPAVLAHPAEATALLRELEEQLGRIEKVLPEQIVVKLRQVRFWVEWEVKPHGAMETHWSAGWLRANGYNPAKAGDIEINNARHFTAWSKKDQPWMVMHELAHAYQCRELGDDPPLLRAAYENARREKLYEFVLDARGKKRRAYALTNTREYFAELTEAYLGRNDFYPFTRAELKTHDPTGFQLMETIWGTDGDH